MPQLDRHSISQLGDPLLWESFWEISQIPRGSGQEKNCSDFIAQLAKDKGYHVEQDQYYNLLVKIPSNDSKPRKTLLLQAHLDMVCEKLASSDHDFEKDPIDLRHDDQWLFAHQTTLGADNGAGVAYLLTILKIADRLVHGPMALIFTVQEEVSMVGAIKINRQWLQGDYLFNIDSSEEDFFILGCAGGKYYDLLWDISYQSKKPDLLEYQIRLEGLDGGHSGADIHKNLANAISWLGYLLYQLNTDNQLYLSQFDCQGARNAVPRSASARFYSPLNKEQIQQMADKVYQQMCEQFTPTEKNLKITVESADQSLNAWTKQWSDQFICFVNLVHTGVISMNHKQLDLTDTSTNLAYVRQNDHRLEVGFLFRSFHNCAKDKEDAYINCMAQTFGATVQTKDNYPSWAPRWDSPLLKQAQQIYQDVLNKPVQKIAIHAGLEAAFFCQANPNLDILSFGPDMENLHTPEERMKIQSFDRIWKFIQKAVEKL